MRHSFCMAILWSALAVSNAAAQQKVDAGHAAAPDVSMRLSGPFAKLQIIGWQSDSISITGTLPKGSRLEAYMGDTPAPARGVKMYVDAANPNAPAGGSLILHVPFGARVAVKTGTADIDVSRMTGELDINVLGGNVRVEGKLRLLNVESIDAGITFDGSADWVRLKSAEGDVTMSGQSPDAAFSTVSGIVRASGGPFERARFETVTGAVTFAGTLLRNSAINIDTHSGAVEVQVPPKSPVDIDAITSNGTIENVLTGRPAVAGRDGRGQEIGLSMGGSGARIVIRSYKGTIRLMGRQ
jgi:hypothetical protein